MRKQGFMKRVLGGIMAVAFGAALCFAAPVKAEAATPWDSTTVTYGQIVAWQAQQDANFSAWQRGEWLEAYQSNARDAVAAQASIAQTTAAAKMYLAGLESGLAGLSLVPEKYRVPVATAIYETQYALRQDAYGFINARYIDKWIAEDNMATALDWMDYYTERHLTDLQVAQAGLALDATQRAYWAQSAALSALNRQLYGNVEAAFDNLLAARGINTNPYGF